MSVTEIITNAIHPVNVGAVHKAFHTDLSVVVDFLQSTECAVPVDMAGVGDTTITFAHMIVTQAAVGQYSSFVKTPS